MDPRGFGGGCLSFSVNNTRLLINTSPDRVRRSAEVQLFIKVRLGIRQKEEEKKECVSGGSP